MQTTLSADTYKLAKSKLHQSYETFYKVYPGMHGSWSSGRQPVHSVYGGAQIWLANSAQKLGELALKNLASYAPDAESFARALELRVTPDLQRKIYERVVQKLKHEAVEDFRIDFEDGYGHRPDEEEDRQAEVAALETAKGLEAGTLPPFLGIRIKSFSEELAQRGMRTLDIFLTTLVSKTKGKLPPNFIVTLPKVTMPVQVTTLVQVLGELENKLHLPAKSLRLEIMIETTQAIFDDTGDSNLLALVKAAEGRCRGAHFGTYDYTASCEIVAKHQTMINPVCNFAKHMMQVSLAGTGVWLSDGATNVMPVGPHKGEALSATEQKENTESVHRAWREAYQHIQHSLRTGFYQGWDLHPAQLPIRYAAVYHFFLENYASAASRLQNFVNKAAQATLLGEIFDDAATGQGLLNYFLRALNCQAITQAEAEESGLTLDEIKSRSFAKIIEGRGGRN